MRIEETRRFPVPPQQVYDYLTDPKTWPLWLAGMLEVEDAETVTWEKPGDRVRFTYRLLGRCINGEFHLEEVIPAQYIKVHTTAPAFGTLTQGWFYSDAGEHSTTLRIICITDEPTSFDGRVIDRSVIPRAIQRDLTATLSNLEAIFSLGLNDQPPSPHRWNRRTPHRRIPEEDRRDGGSDMPPVCSPTMGTTAVIRDPNPESGLWDSGGQSPPRGVPGW